MNEKEAQKMNKNETNQTTHKKTKTKAKIETTTKKVAFMFLDEMITIEGFLIKKPTHTPWKTKLGPPH